MPQAYYPPQLQYAAAAHVPMPPHDEGESDIPIIVILWLGRPTESRCRNIALADAGLALIIISSLHVYPLCM